MHRKIEFAIVMVCCFLFLLPSAGSTDSAKEQSQRCMCPCPCPEETPPEPTSDSELCPETVKINKLVDAYEAVSFSHQEHADYADACSDCHHNSPPGQYKRCVSCHRRGLFDADKLNLPNMQAAYHRLCIACHVDGEAGPTDCIDCHEIREASPSGNRQP